VRGRGHEPRRAWDTPKGGGPTVIGQSTIVDSDGTGVGHRDAEAGGVGARHRATRLVFRHGDRSSRARGRRPLGQTSNKASAHHAGGAGMSSGVGLVLDAPCTGGAASFTVAWRATTASAVTLNTVRSWETVTGPW
jgi:hypothetical protein